MKFSIKGAAPGIYHGIIYKVRYQKGMMFAKVIIPAWSSEKYQYITKWARIAIPWGTMNYGMWGTPKPGMHVWVAFEAADPELPVVIGYHPVKDSGTLEMPPEFDNDNHANKSREKENRELPPERYPKINDAWIAKSSKWGQFYLLHDKLKKAVIRGEEKIEIGELAAHNVLLGDLFRDLYNNHTHQGTVPVPGDDEKITDKHLSQMVFVVHDKSEQPAQPEIKDIVVKVTKLMQSLGGQGGGDPIQGLINIGRDLGLPDDTLDEAQSSYDAMKKGFLDDLAKGFKAATGLDLDLNLDPLALAQQIVDALGMDKAVNLILNALESALKSILPEGVFEKLWEALNAVIEGDWAKAADALGQAIWNAISQFVPDALKDAVQGLINGILNMDPAAIANALAQAGKQLGLSFNFDVSQALEQALPAIANFASQFLPSGLVDAFCDLAQMFLSGDLSGLAQAGMDLMKGAISGALMALGVPGPVANAVTDIAATALTQGIDKAVGEAVGQILSQVPGGQTLAAMATAALSGDMLRAIGAALGGS